MVESVIQKDHHIGENLEQVPSLVEIFPNQLAQPARRRYLAGIQAVCSLETTLAPFGQRPEMTNNLSPLRGEKMNRFLLLILSLACLINLTSCGAMRPPPPNPALVSEIDSYFAAASTKTYPGNGQFSRPAPLSVGQYVITGMTGPEGRSVMQMAVVDQQAQGWVIETR
ncbi:MAG: hypothetical protein V2I32_12285, partial [Desulforhopalus sp.]|nr:hypothetical protein [Desulforhopalus sp.]